MPPAERLSVGAIELAVHTAGDGPLVVLCHGFPDLALTWRELFADLVSAGFRVAAPDLRGYGGSACPANVRDYAIDRLIGDLDGLLAALDADEAYFVGHDWGALLLWQYALQRAQKMRGLIALNIPFYPRPSQDPLAMTAKYLGETHYVVDFNRSDHADSLFDSDPARYLSAMQRRMPITRADYMALTGGRTAPFSMIREFEKATPAGEPLLAGADLDVYAAAFARTGFTPAINWYRNWTRNWELTADVSQRVTVPTLFIEAVDDILIDPRHIRAMADYVDALDIVRLDNCGHWTHREQPEALNAAVLAWLGQHGAGRAG